MKDAARGTFVVETPEQLRALADPLRQRLLGQFAEGATVKQAAQRLGEPPTKLYHHIDHLLAAGLIRVVSEEKKRAVLERTFQAAASRFAVSPAAFGSAGSRVGERSRIARSALEELLAGAADEDGALRLMRTRARLSAASLERLESELGRLIADLEDQGSPSIEIALIASRQT